MKRIVQLLLVFCLLAFGFGVLSFAEEPEPMVIKEDTVISEDTTWKAKVTVNEGVTLTIRDCTLSIEEGDIENRGFILVKERNQPINNEVPAVIPINSSKNVNRIYNSLPNGTILNSVPLYLKGLGEVKIENGTDLDAVVKLVNNYSKKSIYTVYIKAKSTYKISEISDGVYDLYFAHGKDWHKESQKFLVSNSYSKFEDNFDFTTKYEYQSDGVNRIYTILEITLHPVLGGSAKTDTVSENEFSQF